MNAVLTGLGMGIAFWIVVIPASLILIRRSNSGKEFNERLEEYWKERNFLARRQAIATESLLTLAERYSKEESK